MFKAKGAIYANSEYEGWEESQLGCMRGSRGRLVQDEARAGGRGCMTQGAEGHGKTSTLYPESSMYH